MPAEEDDHAGHSSSLGIAFLVPKMEDLKDGRTETD